MAADGKPDPTGDVSPADDSHEDDVTPDEDVDVVDASTDDAMDVSMAADGKPGLTGDVSPATTVMRTMSCPMRTWMRLTRRQMTPRMFDGRGW